jgi:hypothetical protein
MSGIRNVTYLRTGLMHLFTLPTLLELAKNNSLQVSWETTKLSYSCKI